MVTPELALCVTAALKSKGAVVGQVVVPLQVKSAAGEPTALVVVILTVVERLDDVVVVLATTVEADPVVVLCGVVLRIVDVAGDELFASSGELMFALVYGNARAQAK